MDGVIHIHQAARMSRAEALQALASAGTEADRRLAALLQAGPEITEEDEARLHGVPMVPTEINRAVRRVMRGLRG